MRPLAISTPFLALLCGVCSALGDSFSLSASADTFLFNQAADTPQGSAVTLLSYNGPDGSFAYFPLFRFDLSSFAGQTVTGSPTLSLFVGPGGDGTHTVSLVNPPQAFDEATSTFNNYNPTAPSNATKIGTDVIAGTTVSYDQNFTGYINFTLPASLVQGWIDHPASNFGVGVYQSTAETTDTNFSSREASDVNQRPVLAFVAVPEPGSAVLLAASAVGLAALRRRRS